ncbi:MAG: hypothetical protein RL355_739 [Actinomycetota bacterium]|jgi:adenine C2-methylase RlmN of 23S rRNA A2503 and tRNA A37
MKNLNELTARAAAKVMSKLQEVIKGEQGDVPGWVLVTVMTAGLVVALWSIADGQLKSVLQNAIHSVSAP